MPTIHYGLQSFQRQFDEVAMSAVIEANCCIRVLTLQSGQPAEPHVQMIWVAPDSSATVRPRLCRNNWMNERMNWMIRTLESRSSVVDTKFRLRRRKARIALPLH